MQVFLGTSGLSKSQQDDFPEKVSCKKCGGEAQIIFVAAEGFFSKESDRPYIKGLRPRMARNWVHDHCSVANYLCTNCLEITAILSQA